MHRSPASRVDVPPDGAFEIRNVPSGEYTLLVSTIYGDVVHRQLISVNSSSGRFEIRLAEAPVNSPATKKTISLKQLLHPPTKKAFNSFVQAQRFSAAGDFPKAAEALERAVRESPEYAEAHVNLGAQYVRIGRFPEAMAELHRAMEIAGPNPVLLCNLASAQARVGQPAEAIESVRWALRLDSGMVQAHLILGALLANDPRTRAEAIVHLELAADEYESARRILTRLR
jgi:Flp pilus assembly protein TadD